MTTLLPYLLGGTLAATLAAAVSVLFKAVQFQVEEWLTGRHARRAIRRYGLHLVERDNVVDARERFAARRGESMGGAA